MGPTERDGGRSQGQTLLLSRLAHCRCVNRSTDFSVAVRATGVNDKMLPGVAKGELVQAGSICAQLAVFAESAAQTLAVRKDRTQNCDEQISESPSSLITQ